MFYLRDGTGEKTSLMLQSTLCNSHGFSFIPPVINPGDLFQISGDDILRLLALLQGNGFRYIVIDMGTHLPGFEKILSASDRIYMPSRGDTMSSAKIAQFFSYLRTLEDMQIEEKTVRLEPPYFKDIPTAADNLRGTETGNYMAGILYEK